MDFFTIIIVAVLLGTGGLFVLRFLRKDEDEETPAEYTYGILAEARKKELEARKKQFSEKEELERKWRFGIRTFDLFEGLLRKPENSRPPGFQIQSYPDPYDRGNPASVPAYSLALPSDEGEFKVVLYERKYSPDWLRRLEPAAFFRIVEVHDGSKKTVFRALLKFLIKEGAETCTGTVLEELEHGPWAGALRRILTESEKGES